MLISLGGFVYRLQFSSGPTPAESAYLRRFHSPGADDAADFTVRIDATAVPASIDAESIARSGESHLTWNEDQLLLDHPLFHARIDAGGESLFLQRHPDGGAVGLSHLLRASLSVLLPPRCCIPIHACGVSIAGQGLAFFGRSGAGKTTLASTCPYLVLSDEIVVATRHPDGTWGLRQSGIWGGLGAGAIDLATYPLSAALELSKGVAFSLEPLNHASFARALVGMVLVPPNLGLWRRTLELIDSLSTSVPAHRMTWALDDPPWDRLATRFDSAAR